MLPQSLIDALGVTGATRVHGGDIARAYRLQTTSGPLFAKYHPAPKPDLFEREAAGLRALRAHTPLPVRVPEVVRQTSDGLVLEWIEPGPPSAATETDLGQGLAGLHRTTHEHFGGLAGDLAGYLGSAEVDLTPTPNWPEFFVERRLRPLTARAIALGRLDPRADSLLDRLAPRATELCGPPEPPALVHGDLWAGNRLVGRHGVNWLIDPAAHWAHRELDLAMMALFGGFSDRCYAAYDEAFPLAAGWRDRVTWYQLPPLLVHAILFGGSYGAAALNALRHYI